jgi:hypothetical protein
MPTESIYLWTREGVTEAVEDAMQCWPRLREPFVVADAPGDGDAASITWDVTLDPKGDCRMARIRATTIQGGALQQVAQALRAAAPEK